MTSARDSLEACLEECVRKVSCYEATLSSIYGTSMFTFIPRELFHKLNCLTLAFSHSTPFRFDTPLNGIDYVTSWCPWSMKCVEVMQADSFFRADETLKNWLSWCKVLPVNASDFPPKSNQFTWPPEGLEWQVLLDRREGECQLHLQNGDCSELAIVFEESPLAVLECIDRWFDQLNAIFEYDDSRGHSSGSDWKLRASAEPETRNVVKEWFRTFRSAFLDASRRSTALQSLDAEILERLPDGTFNIERGTRRVQDDRPLSKLIHWRHSVLRSWLLHWFNFLADESIKPSIKSETIRETCQSGGSLNDGDGDASIENPKTSEVSELQLSVNRQSQTIRRTAHPFNQTHLVVDWKNHHEKWTALEVLLAAFPQKSDSKDVVEGNSRRQLKTQMNEDLSKLGLRISSGQKWILETFNESDGN